MRKSLGGWGERWGCFVFRHHSPPQIVRVYFLFACIVLCSRHPYCLRAWQRLALAKDMNALNLMCRRQDYWTEELFM